MSVTHRATITINRGTGANVSRAVSVLGEAEINIPALVCAAGATEEIGFVAAIAAIKSILIFANGPCTLRTNNAAPGDDEFALDETNFLFWDTENLAGNPFTVDVDGLFVVVPAGDPVEVTVLACVDITP